MSRQDAAPCISPQYSPYWNDGSLRRASIGDHPATAQGKQGAYRTKPCRYNQAGYCRSGASCPFKHSQDDLQDLNPTVQLRWRTRVAKLALETHPDHLQRALECGHRFPFL
ncbi:hypothetical protein PILCRDRAFT_223901 [Piloderma croceum F 1598]|uniref:C3H1-type domain-containing protein n=1 Tax=Piloderma croceum (strain F 1598) TaxID=765440 RepID=A0A0C3CHZ1_PILCF|nr:hypothetical protein PILCRDRAFT_223901 [Piloderma croceum F 1598]